MSNSQLTPGVVPGRLPAAAYHDNFTDVQAPYARHEALVSADRCYFCHDAPCMTACPTSIDIPLFIRQIATGTPEAAARTIFAQNILGGMCARVCPTEQLCEEACVREAAEGKPVEIGRLQRHATDTLMSKSIHPFTRAAATGKHVAVVGAGPAGLACAHRLALHGHEVTIFERRGKAGGLNEYGIATYKTPDNFAQAEVEWLLKIGGITIRTGVELGRDITLAGLQSGHDAVFLGLGLAGVNALRAAGEDLDGVRNAVDFIADLRQAADKSLVPVGRDVVVIGGGMTAVDAAVQSKLLGAENVTMVYRRGKSKMSASVYEQEHATQVGVRIIYNAAPKRVIGQTRAEAVEFAYTSEGEAGLVLSDETFTLKADQVFKAIGQTLASPENLGVAGGKLVPPGGGIWTGGDCAAGGEDLTVTAVAQGRDAAEAIHQSLQGWDVEMLELSSQEKMTLARIETLEDPDKLRNLIDNARRGKSIAVERAAFLRLCLVQPEATPGTVEHDVWQSIYALEEMKREESGKKIPLNRTRQKITRDGEAKTASDLTLKAKASRGFSDLINLGHPELTFEAIVLRHPKTFPNDTQKAARDRLTVAGVDLVTLLQTNEGA